MIHPFRFGKSNFFVEQNVLAIPKRITEPTVRLIDGPNQFTGRIEIKYLDVWGLIAGTFEEASARVVCRMLGYF